jgi:uncharacterized protein with FMN-binding domain
MKTIVLTLLAGATVSTTAAEPQLLIPKALLEAPLVEVQGVIRTAAKATLVDGVYTGPAVDAYYGPVQVQATVLNGQIVSLKMLRYPSDRRQSLAISQQSLPRLRDEVVRAQTAKVDIVSGATLTSLAFIRSLDGALSQAQSAAL